MNKSEAERILARSGYNWSLSDVEEACAVLDHPELTEEDSANYHKWADPYPRRCYCSAIAYTDKGRVYAISLSDNVKKIHQKIFGTHYPDGSEVRDRCGASVRASVRASVGDSVWAYNGTFFVLPRESWKYTENIKTEEYPFQCLATLWERGLVPSFDGKKWRLHGGKDAEILYEWTP